MYCMAQTLGRTATRNHNRSTDKRNRRASRKANRNRDNKARPLQTWRNGRGVRPRRDDLRATQDERSALPDDRPVPQAARTFQGFDQAAREAGRSRIYGGIHYECDNREGLALGRAVAEEVYRTRLQLDQAQARRRNPNSQISNYKQISNHNSQAAPSPGD